MNCPARRRTERPESVVLNRARGRSALAAVLALAASPNGFTVTGFPVTGFTVTGFAEPVRVMTGQSIAAYSARHASYHLHKIRGKHLGSTNPAEPAATSSHPMPPGPSPPC